MEEINLKDLFNFIVRKIPIIILITVIVVSLGITYTSFFKTPLYLGDATLLLVKNTSGSEQNTSVTQNDILLNQKLVATYSEIIKSRKVLNQVIDELKLDYSFEDLYGMVRVSSVSDTEIIKISVSDENSKRAVRIANTIASVFRTEVMDLYNLENVSIIDKAEVQKEPYNIQPIKDFVLFTAAGIVLSLGIMVMIYYFDTSIKSSEMIEERLGVPVIGNVPLCVKKGKKNSKKRDKKKGGKK